MDHITKQLTQLRRIEPDAAFAHQLRTALMHAPETAVQQKPFRSFLWTFRYAAALGVAAVLIVVAPAMLSSKPNMSAALDADSVTKEFSDLAITIELKSVAYDQVVNQTIASAVDEITNTRTRHLNDSVLKIESDRIPQVGDENTVDAMLDRVIF